jgi:hypothetical protein
MSAIKTAKTTGILGLSLTIAPSTPWKLISLKIHLSAAGGAGNFVATLDASAGAAYDTIIFTQDLTLLADMFWQPDSPIFFNIGDKLVITWANANGRTYGIEAVYEVL